MNSLELLKTSNFNCIHIIKWKEIVRSQLQKQPLFQCPYRSMWATIEGPYQSPAFFPELLPISTNWWIPKGAEGWSSNQTTSLRCMGSACLSLVDSGLFFWLLLGGWSLDRDFSAELDPRGEPKEGMGTPPARAGERGLNTSKSTSVSCWASGQAQSTGCKKACT